MKQKLWLTLVTYLAYCVDKELWKAIDYLKEQVRVLQEQQEIHAAYRQLLQLRRELGLARPDLSKLAVETGTEKNKWLAMGPDDVMLVANLSDRPVTAPYGGELIWSFTQPSVELDRTSLGPWEFALIRR